MNDRVYRFDIKMVSLLRYHELFIVAYIYVVRT